MNDSNFALVTIAFVDTAHEFLAAAYARTGRVELARKEAAMLAQVFPENSLALYRIMYDYYKNEQDLTDYLDALKLAGVPAWPYGVEGRPEDRVTGGALKDLVTGRSWTGRTWNAGPEGGVQFVQQIDAENRFAYRSASSFFTGVARLDNDELCIRYDGRVRDRWLCGGIYRNTDEAIAGDYFYISPLLPRYFTVAP